MKSLQDRILEIFGLGLGFGLTIINYIVARLKEEDQLFSQAIIEPLPRAQPCSLRASRCSSSSYTMAYFHAVNPVILNQTLHRSLFTTRNKFMGLAPLTVQEGDQVFLLAAADVPCVLRHVQNEEYRLVGQCYTHGIMYGEAVDAMKLVDVTLI